MGYNEINALEQVRLTAGNGVYHKGEPSWTDILGLQDCARARINIAEIGETRRERKRARQFSFTRVQFIDFSGRLLTGFTSTFLIITAMRNIPATGNSFCRVPTIFADNNYIWH